MSDRIDRFWGDYRWLSNFWPCQIELGITYASVEHAYQAHKAQGVLDHLYVATSATAGEAKRRGQALELRPDWDGIKLDLMERCLRLKFAPGSELAQRLLDTGDAELIEGNSWGDVFWGVCGGVGQNHLGRLLMQIRTELHEVPDEHEPAL